MMGHKQKLTGAEQDVFTPWRHLLCWRPGEKSRVKKGACRRERREGKRQTREDW